jgi:hypothetical protein
MNVLKYCSRHFQKKKHDFGKGSERQKSLCRKSKKNIESLKVDRKFEKDQNVESQISNFDEVSTTYGVSTYGVLA